MLEEFGKLVLGLYRGSREVPIESFQDWAFDHLKRFIAFDSAAWLTSTLHSMPDSAIFHTRHVYKQPPELLSEWLQCKGATTFPRKVFAAAGTALTCTPATDMEPEVTAHCHRYGIAQILTIALVDSIAGLHEMISLYRQDIARPFSEEERQFQQCLAPHLSETWRNCRMKHLAFDSQDSHAAGADNHGVLHLIEPGFTLLLREEWPDWNGPLLPKPLLAACRNGEGRHIGKRIAFYLASFNDHITLRARQKSPIDTLSKRELEVAQHYASGQDHKQIANILGLSPATVRNHLKAIYDKLAIDNKAALSAMVNF